MELLKKSILNILEDNKAEDLSIIDVKNKSSVTDTMIIVSGRSTRHVKAIADNLVTRLKKNKVKPDFISGDFDSLESMPINIKTIHTPNQNFTDLGGWVVGVRGSFQHQKPC